MPKYQVTDNLWFGSQDSCRHNPSDDFAFVHACKEPCHRHGAGYKDKSLASTHPHYLAVEKDRHLYLNLIDPPVPLFKLESFALFFDFMDRMIVKRPVLIHCNQGESRAPSLTLLYMAKRLGLLPDADYKNARKSFEEKFTYKPGKGIETFLEQNWDLIGV
jgi:hypothetical protein